ncbi:MAG: DNA methyltransferase [Planctomycetota bacterium]
MRRRSPDKRSLAGVGGRTECRGDAALAPLLRHALQVDPRARLPFTHGFHAYPARMHPETARRLLAHFAGPGARVLDPFVGSGTVALEALRLGLPCAGVDISRVALEIAWARPRVMVPAECRAIEQAGARLAHRLRSVPQPHAAWPAWAVPVRSWFSTHTLAEVCLLKAAIDDLDDERRRRLLLCVLSSLLVKLSKQASDSAPVVDRAYRPWPPGAAYGLFASKCAELTRSLLLLSSDLHKRKVVVIEPALELGDARTHRFGKGSFDVILTSPPYPATYDYAHHQQLRYALYGGGAQFAEAHELGSRRDLRGRRDAYACYQQDLTRALENAMRALAPGGRVLLLIGDGRIGARALRTDELVAAIAPRLGASVQAMASQARIDWSSSRRQRKHEHLLLLTRSQAAGIAP